MKPSSYPYELHNRSLPLATNSLAQLPTISCPRGTVPILQNSKDSNNTMLCCVHTLHYHGSHVSINVYEPKVKENTEDLSASWVLMLNKQDASHLESIGAGSIVWPSYSGDNFARFHITWRDNTLDSMCFDHDCPGFVQVNPRIALGSRIQQVSVYNGPQHFIDVLLFKDPKTKDWWVALAGTPIGYWPSSIFSHLKDKVTEAALGGHVNGPTAQSYFPEMGSGHFSSEWFGKAAYVSNIKIVHENNNYFTPDTEKHLLR
ncbi:hypothetical protein BRADI_4g43812v3, partial [Brachypodium distachyon]